MNKEAPSFEEFRDYIGSVLQELPDQPSCSRMFTEDAALPDENFTNTDEGSDHQEDKNPDVFIIGDGDYTSVCDFEHLRNYENVTDVPPNCDVVLHFSPEE